MNVNFKFGIDRKVKVEKLGVTGIIAMCAIDGGGVTYYLNAAGGGGWYAERLLADAEGE
jgi:hypothetical protein